MELSLEMPERERPTVACNVRWIGFLSGQKGFDAPLMQRALIRYALSCDDDACKQFAAARRRADPETVKDVEESLKFDKLK